MADDSTSGLSTALASVGGTGGARLPLLDTEELDLFHDPAAIARDAKGAAVAALAGARGRGRPRGSSNKRTAKWRDYLAARYAHPLEVLAQFISRTPAELAAELSCSLYEAGVLIKSSAAELAPYMESKMPTLAHVSTDSGVTILMPGLNAPTGATMAELEAMAIDDVSELDLDVLDAHVPAGAKVVEG